MIGKKAEEGLVVYYPVGPGDKYENFKVDDVGGKHTKHQHHPREAKLYEKLERKDGWQAMWVLGL